MHSNPAFNGQSIERLRENIAAHIYYARHAPNAALKSHYVKLAKLNQTEIRYRLSTR